MRILFWKQKKEEKPSQDNFKEELLRKITSTPQPTYTKQELINLINKI